MIPFSECIVPDYLLWKHTIFPIPDFIRELVGYNFDPNETYMIKPDHMVNTTEDYFYKLISISPNNRLVNQENENK